MTEHVSVLATLSNELADAVKTGAESLVAVHARRRIPTSGVVWSRGIVVSTNHTVRRDEGIEVTLPDGSQVPGELLGRDAGTDLAVLSVPEAEPPATLGSVDDLFVGNLVLAIGRPGKDATATLGIVSAVGDEWRTWHGGLIDRFVRLDLAVYDGFSGGALLDAAGRTIGINTSGLARAAAMTVPVTTVSSVVSQIQEHGTVRHGYLGFGLQPVRLPPGTVASGATFGLVVVSLEPAGPAASAGILLGDILTVVQGHAITDADRILALVRSSLAGQSLDIELLRGGVPTELSVVVGTR